MTKELEKELITLVAVDRIYKPISSLSGKLKNRKPKLAKAISLPSKFYEGERVWARIEEIDKQKARGMRQGIQVFSEQYPSYGEKLRACIEEQRIVREKHLYYEMQEGCKIPAQDYMNVMSDLGFTPAIADRLYHELMNVGRNLAKKRKEKQRSTLIG